MEAMNSKCTGVFCVTTAKGPKTTVQLHSWSLMVGHRKSGPALSRTVTDTQCINTTIPEPYTVATRTIPDAAIFPECHR
ncbi:hypothetical protein DPMN_193980 [Dreissena polymorpha]|uniref:Uncharacterized protein n=1 Tax=Dreissena polymorpha TaxID=45954 RepID=A0A9D3Y574_DREPO|nr:hypothetical protein DPMN_193980 [Dreissena polymorpha]